MTTGKDILDEVSAQLHGWGSTQDRITPLTNDITNSALTFTVDFAFGQSVGIAPGVVEIDSEQLYVTSIDPTSGTVTVANGFGRGYGGTTAVAHTAGTRVVSRPRFPRIWLLKQVNEVINGVFPDLFVPKTFTGSVTYPSNTYTLTPAPLIILDAQWQDPIGNWRKCQSYTFDSFDGSFRLGPGPMIGRPLRVIYGVKPTTLVNEASDFTLTGLPASSLDVILLGTVAKQVPGIDISRAQSTSVEQSDRSRVVPPNAGITVARYIVAEYQERLANEARALRKQFKPRLVRTF